MSRSPSHPHLILRPFGRRSEPLIYETGDYTIPDPLDARLGPIDELFIGSDFDESEPTTLTRQRWQR